MTELYKRLARTVNALQNCQKSKNEEWQEKHQETIDKLMENAPSGSGIDCGTTLELDKCTDNKLVFSLSYHHMNDQGYYCGWSEHTLEVTGNLMHGIELNFNSDLSGVELEAMIPFDDDFDNEDTQEATQEDLEWVEEQTIDYLYEIYEYWLKEKPEQVPAIYEHTMPRV